MEALMMGADGWVAGLVCAFPAETVAVYRLVKSREKLKKHYKFSAGSCRCWSWIFIRNWYNT